MDCGGGAGDPPAWPPLFAAVSGDIVGYRGIPVDGEGQRRACRAEGTVRLLASYRSVVPNLFTCVKIDLRVDIAKI